MKQTLLIVFSIVMSSLSAASGLDKNALSAVDSKVVMVVQQVFVDSASTEAGTWAVLEKALGEPILGTYLTISSGTGFFLNGQGVLLTNAHVVDFGDSSQRIREVISGIQDYLSGLSDNQLSNEQKFKLRIDISKMLRSSKIVLRVLKPTGDFVDAAVLSKEDKVDLALLQVTTPSGTAALPLSSDDTDLPLGTTVAAVGFPLPELFDSLFGQKRLTVTQGSVSAIRDDVWSIQHTAPLNPGNSGGPLLNEHGQVVGVNVGLIKNTNGLFFAIDLHHINAFLQETGHFDVWQANQALSAAGPEMADLVQKVVGDTVVINSDKGAVVYRDNKKLGPVPLIFNVTEKTVQLRIEGARGESSVVLTHDADINQTMTVDVPLGPHTGVVSLTSSPSGAVVYVDGATRGKTPFNGPLPVGTHQVQLKLEGYRFDDQTVTVRSGSTATMNVAGTKLYVLTLNKPLPPGTKLVLQGSRTLTLTDPNPLVVPEGRWTVSVDNPDYLRHTTLTIDTSQPLTTLDVSSWFLQGVLRFQNLASDTSLQVDGEEIGPVRDNVDYPVTTGTHDIKLTSHQYFDYATTVKVVNGQPCIVVAAQTQSRRIAHDDWLAFWGYSTLGLGVVSVPMLLVGTQQDRQYVNQHPGSVAKTSPFSIAGGFGVAAALITGSVFIAVLRIPAED